MELLPLPPDEQSDPAAVLLPFVAPVPVPVPPPLGQVATLPTVSMCPPTVEVPSGSTIDTASPGFTRYSWLTSRSTVTMGVVLVAVEHRATAPPRPRPRRCHRHRHRRAPTDEPTEGVTEVTRMGPGSKTTWPSRISPVAGRPSALCQRSTAVAVADE